MPLYDYEKFFPFKSIREQQKRAIEFAIDAYESGKKVVLMEIGTGVGKSAIAITVARYLDTHVKASKDEAGMPISGAYVITTQKVLQDQYTRDFGPESRDLVRSIKSSSNYKCHFYTDNTCAQSKRILMKLGKRLKGTEFEKQCKNDCEYSRDKQAFLDSPISVTNFSYFLAETNYSGRLTKRSLLVTDEAHNLESELGKFIEVSFSEKFARDVLKCKVPKLDTQDTVFGWIQTSYRKSLAKYLKSVEKNLVKFSDEIEGYSSYSKQFEMLEKHGDKVDKFLSTYDPNNWVMNVTYPQDGNKRGARKFEFKPVDVSKYSDEVYFKSGDKLLMMSATIIDRDVFCESVGISTKDVAYLKIPSPFLEENRPIHFLPVGSMSRNNIDKTLPVMAEVVKMLLDKHAGEKGVIHCVEGNSHVLMSDNTEKRICDLSSGDKIYTYNETTKLFEVKSVLSKWSSGKRQCLKIELENGKTLVCTPEHLVLTRSRGWIQAKNLDIDDDIVSV